MLSLNLQRSPRRTDPSLHPHTQSASRLHKSASVPKLSLQPPSASHPHPPPHSPQPSFVLRAGVKHHPFPKDAPYPLSYHKNILTCDALDHATLKSLYQSSSSIDFTDRGPPTRCLDLGCGPGAWVLEAANEWPDCEFVGFDLVNIQIPPHRLSPKYANRITWVQGNFLIPLPFEDAYFDHVHIRQIARGIPEDKWDLIMAEVVRVLKVGGSVEIFEEDIIFPVLPRSSTATPRKRKRKTSTALRPLPTLQGSASITKHLSLATVCDHDHAVLETLFYRLFERRFINLKPTALIMSTLNIHMRYAGGSPLINFPLPPAPLPHDLSVHATEAPHSSRSTTPRMLDRREGEIITSRSSTPVPERRDMDEDWQISSTASSSRCSTLYSEKSTPATSVAEFEDPAEGPIAFFSDAGLASVSSSKSKEKADILPEGRLRVTAGTLGLNLYRSWQGVMACREAMWDEYQSALQAHDPLLDLLEWEDHEINLLDRDKFDILMERYQGDMEARYPMADALVSDLHWDAPRRDANKDDKATKQAIAEARSDALRLERSGIGAVPEGSRVCRKARIFIGRKGAVFGVE